jgi:hypothetical protein
MVAPKTPKTPKSPAAKSAKPAAPAKAPKAARARAPAAPRLGVLRAPEHRRFLTSDFGQVAEGVEIKGLTYLEILANPKLAELGRRVYNDLRIQFADDKLAEDSDATRAYRLRLEGWAAVLETMLEEVLDEIDALKGGDPGANQGGLEALSAAAEVMAPAGETATGTAGG